MGTFVIASELSAAPDTVWRHATSPEGINDELAPWLKMSLPRGVDDLSVENVPLGEKLGRSWILLFGLVPVDYDDITVVEIEPGHFIERSRTASARVWQHERTITPRAGGCIVEDRLGFAVKRPLAWLPGADRVARAIVGAIFRHRHRRLRARFGG